MQGYLTIDKGKEKTALFKMGLCLWICRDSKILKSVMLFDVPIIVKSRIYVHWNCSNTALAWLGHGDVRPRTNSCMLRDPGVESATGRANVARRALRATVFIYYTGSQSKREVVFVTKQGRYNLSIA